MNAHGEMKTIPNFMLDSSKITRFQLKQIACWIVAIVIFVVLIVSTYYTKGAHHTFIGLCIGAISALVASLCTLRPEENDFIPLDEAWDIENEAKIVEFPKTKSFAPLQSLD